MKEDATTIFFSLNNFLILPPKEFVGPAQIHAVSSGNSKFLFWICCPWEKIFAVRYLDVARNGSFMGS
jgi:hypothetical protein